MHVDKQFPFKKKNLPQKENELQFITSEGIVLIHQRLHREQTQGG